MRKHRAPNAGAVAFLSLMGRVGGDVSGLCRGNPLSVSVRFERFRWAVWMLADGRPTSDSMKLVANEIAVCQAYAEHDFAGAGEYLEICQGATAAMRRLLDRFIETKVWAPSEDDLHLFWAMVSLREAVIDRPEHSEAYEASIDEQIRQEAQQGLCVIYA